MDPDAGMVQKHGQEPYPPDRVTIKRMTAQRVALYRQVPPPVHTIPVEVTPLPADDLISEYTEVMEAAKRLRLNLS